MGEIAEMMMDGDLCEVCGEYLGEGQGFPRRCEDCEKENKQKKKKRRKIRDRRER